MLSPSLYMVAAETEAAGASAYKGNWFGLLDFANWMKSQGGSQEANASTIAGFTISGKSLAI